MASTQTMGRDGVTLRVLGWDGSSLGAGTLGGADPLGFAGGDTNLYRYVHNDPTDRIDPTGLSDVLVYTGSDIGDSLRKGLKKLEQDFNKLSDARKQDIANKLYKLPDALNAWDIPSLLGKNLEGFGIAKGQWGTGNGVGTVTVDGKPYAAAAVNYILWGKLNRLCSDEFKPRIDGMLANPDYAQAQLGYKPHDMFTIQETLNTVRNYRKYKNVVDGGGVENQVIWSQIGYTGDWSLAGKAVISKPGYNYIPNPNKYNGGLYWRVGSPPADGRDRSQEGSRGIIDFVE